MLRTAAALGAAATVAMPGTVDLWNAKVVRSAMGAHFTHPAFATSWQELDAWRQAPARRRCGARTPGGRLWKPAPPKCPSRLALVVGNEGGGLTDEARGRIERPVALPIADVESLNVAVAAGILLYDVAACHGPPGGARDGRRRWANPVAIGRRFRTAGLSTGDLVGADFRPGRRDRLVPERVHLPLADGALGRRAALAVPAVPAPHHMVREHPAGELGRARRALPRMQTPDLGPVSGGRTADRARLAGRIHDDRVATHGAARRGVRYDHGRRRDHRPAVLSDPGRIHGVRSDLGRCHLGRRRSVRDGGGFANPYDALIGACVGAGAISIIGWLGEVVLKKEAMGFGDVTLMAVVGAAVGPGRTLLTVFFGASLGAVVFLVFVLPYTWVRSRRKQVPFEPPLVPFGVFLAPAALVALLWGYRLIAWYLGRIGLL